MKDCTSRAMDSVLIFFSMHLFRIWRTMCHGKTRLRDLRRTSAISLFMLVSAIGLPIFLSVPSTVSGAQSYVLQQGSGGYSGATDAQLRSDRASKNFANNAILKVQADSWIESVLRFDLASVPAGSTVQNATLKLYLASKNDAKSFNLGLYRLLRPWTATQVTWNQALSNVKWGNSGANKVGTDREGTAVATTQVNATGQWYSLDITAAVQGWINSPSANYGIVLRGDNSNNAEFNFASSENGTAQNRPTLSITLGTSILGTPVPGTTPTPTPTTIVSPTPTPTPATSPTPTPTPIATATPTPTSTATPTPAPTGIWRPPLNVSWHWMIDHAIDINNAKDMGLVDPNGNTLSNPVPQIYDIDGFYNGYDPNKNVVDVNGKYNWNDPNNDQVAKLHALGKKVICYIDVGVYEDYREDAYKFPASVIGNADSGWNGSYWLDIRRTDILGPIMEARMKMCKDKGFDAIEPDEIDGYSNNPGFPLTYADQINYNKFIANMAHSMGMSIGLKGDIDQVKDLHSYFDWTLNEECYQYNECNLLQPFVNDGKAVFQVEYKTATGSFCPSANASNYNAMKMPLNLNGGRWPCR